MFIETSLQEQVERQRGDRLRVLVVGGGVAGLTLAQLLRRGGLNPVLAERAPDNADAGYMLALMPLVEPAMRALGVRDAYRARSAPFHRYRLHGRHGPLLREYEIDTLLDARGDYRGLARGELLEALGADGAPISHGASVEALRQTGGTVETVLRDGHGAIEAAFDAVVLADGLHSENRARLLDPDEVATYDTGWAGWVAWIETDAAHADQGDEIWGAGFFVGVYPVKGRAGVFVGGDRAAMREGPAAFVAHIRRQLGATDPWLERALTKVAANEGLYVWNLTDCRADRWAVGRVALLGDAAASFLPTAGIGAGMAMESAAVLAPRLIGASPETVGEALLAYERAQRPRVEAAQDSSRRLAQLMFRRSRALAAIRDLAVRLVPLATVLRPIRKLLDERPLTA